MKMAQIIGIIFLRFIAVSANMQNIYVRENKCLRDKKLVDGNLGEFETGSVIRCTNQCFKTESCMSIFYKSQTKECVLSPFLGAYLVLQSDLTTMSDGWECYEKVDGFGSSNRSVECIKSGFLYDPPTDACYIMQHDVDRVVDGIYQLCASMSSELIKIDSQERQDWITGILGHVAKASDDRVCIQGNNDNGEIIYKFDNGTPMTFFNWENVDGERQQPNGGPNQYITIRIDKDFKWYDWGSSSDLRTCLVVCEK